ncbi:hypothetical protein HELRODRAFT_191881 [Helobdella robusta]|uniref:Anoctamin n=1 Tax=Helobdella robusta TaxID=6412 RepID=T1FTD8_HELRO|nr:hypothetical protein HELRODRAFT_191881 [Helobdella robusta]ESO03576.1 hypothetical protein HELRODRAFT_191881 [Helobdella robusta]
MSTDSLNNSNEVVATDDDASDLDDLESSVDERTLVVLQFLANFPAETIAWFVEKLTDPIAKGGAELDVRFIKDNKKQRQIYAVGASVKRLLEGAERMGLKKRFQDDTMRDFILCNIHLYQGSNDLDKFLSTREKQQIIMHEIESVRFKMPEGSSEISVKGFLPGLPKLFKDQVIFSACRAKNLLTYFPLHDKRDLRKLIRNWVRSFWSFQPLDDIHDYFGDSITIYFAFLGFYTTFLLPPAILGVFFYLLSFFISYNIIGFFCIFNIIWSSIFLVLWKRESSKLAYKWGSINHSRFDEPRPELWSEEICTNPVTGKFEPFCDYKSKYVKFYTISLPIIIVCLIVSLFVGITYFWVEDSIRNWAFSDLNKVDLHSGDYQSMTLPWDAYVISVMVTIVYGMAIYGLDIGYRYLAVRLNNYENHRLQSSYENFLIAKLVVFNFVNYFCNLFYIAFVLRDYNLLQKNLATLLITWQIIQQAQETVVPYFTYKYKKYRVLGKFSSGSHINLCKKDNDETINKSGGAANDDDDDLKIAENKYQIEKDATKIDYPFGYVFLFSACYPTSALWAFLNNLTEIRTDAFKLVLIHKRPFSRQADGIGSWLLAFELMGIVAVITNCTLVAINDDVLHYFYSVGYSDVGIFVLFVMIEHLLLFVKATISLLVPALPEDIKTNLARIDYEAQLAWTDKTKKLLGDLDPTMKKNQ